MGRHAKTVRDGTGLDRRESGYYSTPEYVAQFLARQMLALAPTGRRLLDPCVGREELLIGFKNADLSIDTIDIIDFGVHSRGRFTQGDFLRMFADVKQSPLLASEMSTYDFYVANPPYNCHEVDYIRSNKAWLEDVFADIGIENTYSMFVAALIDSAPLGAIIGLVVHDSFLTAKSHAALRRKILDKCAVHVLTLCPQDLFRDQGADVRTCVLVLQRGRDHQRKVRVLDRPATGRDFRAALLAENFLEVDLSDLVLDHAADNSEFVVGVPKQIRALFSGPRLGDGFHCVTGISTGNDKKYLSAEKQGKFQVPFFKNPASRRFYSEPDAFLPEDFLAIPSESKTFMVRNKHLLFREGLTCSSMGTSFSACHLPAGSTFGVNPNVFADDSNDLWWLLGYLNSSLVSYVVRTSIVRTNMITSGYASRIPVPVVDLCVKQTIGDLARAALQTKQGRGHEATVEKIDSMLYQTLKISAATQTIIADFCRDITRRT